MLQLVIKNGGDCNEDGDAVILFYLPYFVLDILYSTQKNLISVGFYWGGRGTKLLH
jgi:hypothetical protein